MFQFFSSDPMDITFCLESNDPWSNCVIEHVLSKLSSQILQCHYNLSSQSNHQVKPSRTCDFNIFSGCNNKIAVVPNFFRLSVSPASKKQAQLVLL
jgi:hypothetical protein